MNVLGNLPADRRQNYKELVAALETRYGSTHRTELARVRFKHRVKQKDESLAAYDLRTASSIPVRVMNVSNQARRVRKGMEVASIEPVECVVGAGQEIDRKEERFSSGGDQVEIATHLQDLFERSKKES